ncbi:CAAX prenyl protease [Maritalea myrionectae]|uniref:CAAX prenyl protease n=1 Tax=Maritalea myrionectae TaxID=454601 RepID=A0A2R4MBF1_9HYPH|nr:CPBP family intramembrane glutamic endopeptidase [Maritalea myrionectae]AVX03342.1 CAAX prenyl protease [Maritalea myrionectae]
MRQIALFLGLTWAWSWGLWWPYVVYLETKSLPFGLGPFFETAHQWAAWGPFVAAMVTALVFSGGPGVKQLLARGGKVKFAAKYYGFMLLVFPVLIGGALWAAVLLGENIPLGEAWDAPQFLPIAFIFILLLGGPLQEEFGWRGILLPKLLDRTGPEAASILIGLIWGLWHLPLFFMPAQSFYYERPIWGLVLSTTLISFFFTWLYKRTGGSIWAMLILHTMYNFSHYVFPSLENDLAATLLWPLQLVVVALIIWDWRRQREI